MTGIVLMLGVGFVVGVLVAFVAVLLPFRQLCKRAGFSRGWAWAATLLLVISQIVPFVVPAWAGIYTDRLQVAATLRPWLSAVPAVAFFALLWVFAFVRWPTIRSVEPER